MLFFCVNILCISILLTVHGRLNIYIDRNAVDLWEHVSPAKVIKDGKYKNIRDWEQAAKKIETANRIFTEMTKEGLMAGARVFPKAATYTKETKQYRIFLENKF
jgi:hypothetical protein